MGTGCTLGYMRPDQVVGTYALVLTVVPALDLGQWRRITSQRRWTTVVATDVNDYVRGVALSSAGPHPIAGYLLDVPVLVVGSAVNNHEIARSLFLNARQRAQAAGCHYMRFWLRGPDTLTSLWNREFYDRWDHGMIYQLDAVRR